MIGIAIYFAALVASIVIRIPHDRRSRETKVRETRKGALEITLLAMVAISGLLLPIVYAATSLLAFADRSQPLPVLVLGVLTVVAWLWLFHRAHNDLGRNWSATLEVRAEHQLVATGVYSYVRHPMYSSLFLHAAAQALLLANWIAGPAMLIGFGLLFALRVGPEERMMLDTFGDAYRDYARRTKRLIPGVW